MDLMEDPTRKPDRFEFAALMAQGMRYAGVATQFGVALLLFGYGGYRIDAAYGWTPWGLLTGILTGMGLGLWNMIRQLDRIEKSQNIEESKRQDKE
jgi:ATP synthase protein I